jgi:putative endonuclease
MSKGGFVYITGSQNHSTLYTGVTSDIVSRMIEHREKLYPSSFTAKYNCTKLLFYKFLDSIESAIEEEKRIKGGSRKKKDILITSENPDWRDLWEDIKQW